MMLSPSPRELVYALHIVGLIQLFFFGMLYFYTDTHRSIRKTSYLEKNNEVSDSREYDYYEYDAEPGDAQEFIEYKPTPKIRKNTEGGPKLLLFNEKLCESEENVTFMYIYSAPGNTEKRHFIRETYANKSKFSCYKLKTVFLLGLLNGQNEVPYEILLEQRVHKDILVGDFIENYRNLSWKGLTALNYILNYCKNARFIIKTDDDTILDIRWILENLHTEFIDVKYFMFGKVRFSAPPRRCVPKHRWCVSKVVYPGKVYPDYCIGNGFVFSSGLVKFMYAESMKIPIHPVDDIYITGLLLQNAPNKTLVDYGPNFLEDFPDLSVHRLRLKDDVVVAHLPGIYEMKMGWETMEQRYAEPPCGRL